MYIKTVYFLYAGVLNPLPAIVPNVEESVTGVVELPIRRLLSPFVNKGRDTIKKSKGRAEIVRKICSCGQYEEPVKKRLDKKSKTVLDKDFHWQSTEIS